MTESLTAKSAARDLLPITQGTVTLSEHVPEAITSLSAFGSGNPVLPGPGETKREGATLLLWSGRNQAFAVGPAPAPRDGISHTDQSDAWAVLTLSGAHMTDVLARLTPLDLRVERFAPGHTARSLLGHMNVLFHRKDPIEMEILVFRSMAATAVHEISEAMEKTAARKGLEDAKSLD